MTTRVSISDSMLKDDVDNTFVNKDTSLYVTNVCLYKMNIWTVLKNSFINSFIVSLCLGCFTLLGTVLLKSTSVVEKITSIALSFTYSDVDIASYFTISKILILVCVMIVFITVTVTVISVLMACFYNVVSRFTGGIQMVVGEPSK